RHVVDRNLQPFKTSAIELLDAIGREQIAVGDHAGNHPTLANAFDDAIELGMKQRFSAADGDDSCSQGSELIDTLKHRLRWHRLGEIVELVAVSACQIATPDRNNVRQQRMIGGE